MNSTVCTSCRTIKKIVTFYHLKCLRSFKTLLGSETFDQYVPMVFRDLCVISGSGTNSLKSLEKKADQRRLKREIFDNVTP